MRPIAVTHQTDSEQRLIDMANRYENAKPDRPIVTAPNGLHPHSPIPKGHYVLLVTNANNVPSERRWIYLH